MRRILAICLALMTAAVCVPGFAAGISLAEAAPHGTSLVETDAGVFLTGLAATPKGSGHTAAETASWLAFSGGAPARVEDAQGNPLPEEAQAATGHVIRAGEMSVIVVVSGDVRGTGRMDIIQLSQISRAVIGVEPLEGAARMAADLNHDGSVGLTDIVLAARILTDSDETLEEGAQSVEVGSLQRRLQELRYYSGAVSGVFDAATKAAVTAFQGAAGLPATGVFDAATRELLFAADAPAAPLPLSGVVIGIDPGHQGKGDSRQEPVAPGSSATKARVTSGTQGLVTKTPEYQINLAVGLRLRDLLQEAGATVVMSRETHDVNISNAERAALMNAAGADLVVRIHCDGETDTSRHGAFILIPSGPYAALIQGASRAAAETVLEAFIEKTGAKNLGLSERSDQTGFNWSEVPVIGVEMGHLSNPDEDRRLSSEAYQELCAQGLAEGVKRCFIG